MIYIDKEFDIVCFEEFQITACSLIPMEKTHLYILLLLLFLTSLCNSEDYKYDDYEYYDEYNYNDNQKPDDYADDYSQESNDYYDRNLLAPKLAPLNPPQPPPLPLPPPMGKIIVFLFYHQYSLECHFKIHFSTYGQFHHVIMSKEFW